VLIVDDVETIARHVRRVVLKTVPGAAVDVFHDIETARRSVLGGSFDLALLDLHVGRESSVAFARELRASMPHLPIVFITGEPASAAAAEARELGPLAVLGKPFTSEALRAVVLRALGEPGT
jgi:DNA-binding response OmpR family regulator